jgi:hypothetical protein
MISGPLGPSIFHIAACRAYATPYMRTISSAVTASCAEANARTHESAAGDAGR